MKYDIKPIETKYAGHNFRSKLEARLAKFLTTLGVNWTYGRNGQAVFAGGCAVIDWKKLEEDLAEAKCVALDLPHTDDGGSCNRDSACIRLERANRGKMNEVAARVGLSIISVKRLGQYCFLVSPPGPGQASRLTAQAESMVDTLKASGWDVCMWWQVD